MDWMTLKNWRTVLSDNSNILLQRNHKYLIVVCTVSVRIWAWKVHLCCLPGGFASSSIMKYNSVSMYFQLSFFVFSYALPLLLIVAMYSLMLYTLLCKVLIITNDLWLIMTSSNLREGAAPWARSPRGTGGGSPRCWSPSRWCSLYPGSQSRSVHCSGQWP